MVAAGLNSVHEIITAGQAHQPPIASRPSGLWCIASSTDGATCSAFFSAACCADLFRHRLVGIDAPEIGAGEPALDALRLEAAPAALAFQQPRDDAMLGPRDGVAGAIGLAHQGAERAGDDDAAPRGEHAL